MIRASQQVLEKFEIRKSKKQKKAFRDWLCQTLEREGYDVRVESGKDMIKSHNVVAGDPERAKLLLTAHYDTAAALPFPNFITPRNLVWYLLYQLLIVAFFIAAVFVMSFLVSTLMLFVTDDTTVVMLVSMVVSYAFMVFLLWWILDGKANVHNANDNTSGVVMLLETAMALPREQRDHVCFVFFDNEERGMLGSAAFAKVHKRAKEEIPALNFDCVGDGDSIQFFLTKRAKKTELPRLLRQAFEGNSKKTVEVVEGFGFYPSDQLLFRHGVGVCALKHNKVLGYYMDRIHTAADKTLDESNIRLLRRGVNQLLRLLTNEETVHAK